MTKIKLQNLLPPTPAKPLKGRGHVRVELPAAAEHLFDLVPDSHRAKVSEKTGNGFGPLAWHLTISPEAQAALQSDIDAAVAAANAQRQALHSAAAVELRNNKGHNPGAAFLEVLLPDGRWIAQPADGSHKKNEWFRARAKLGSIFTCCAGNWVGDLQSSVSGSWISMVVKVNGEPTLVHAPIERRDEIAALYVAGFRPVTGISLDVATIRSTTPGAATNEHGFMAVFPAATKFAAWDCGEDKDQFASEFHSTWGDGAHVVWEGPDGRLWIEYLGCFDDEFEADSELGFRHYVFSGAEAAQRLISLDHAEQITDEVVSRPSEEEIAARQAEREAADRAAAEAAKAEEAAKAQRVEKELQLVPGAKISRETEKALLVSTETQPEAWFPKSQTRFQDGCFFASAWILGQKGWL